MYSGSIPHRRTIFMYSTYTRITAATDDDPDDVGEDGRVGIQTLENLLDSIHHWAFRNGRDP